MNEAMKALAVTANQCAETLQSLGREFEQIKRDTQMRLLAVLRRVGAE